MDITVLCKVVDNYGDVGVVWRLCKNLITLRKDLSIHLVIDDLISFNKICSQVDCNKPFQSVYGINIYDWKDNSLCYDNFIINDGEKLNIILECFQCGRPDWMEKILFEVKLARTVQIIMIDYLTAEKYAEDFHCLDSLTRSSKVRKVNFMPGFTEKTGGLIIDDKWRDLRNWNSEGDILVFTYEKNWTPLVKAIQESLLKSHKVLLAQGRGRASFEENALENNLNIDVLPFVNQEKWDEIMQSCSVLIIRGEESMSRACLSGIPFVWQAYPQSDEYQLVKVNALLDRMEKHFKSEDFELVKNVWLALNQPENEVTVENMYNNWKKFLDAVPELVYGFKDFALDLRKNGDLCYNLMTFIEQLVII